MTNPGPSLSVIVPAHNAGRFLREALDSVFAQGIPDPDVVVVDDGSTDDTAAVAEGYGRGVRVIRQAASGSARARNTGLDATRGELVAFLDADDLWVPEKTRLQLEVLEAHPGAGLVFSDMVGFREDRIEATTYFRQRGFTGACTLTSIFLHDMISTPTVILRRSCLRQAGRFDESLPIGQDTDLWFRIALAHPFVVVDRPLVRRRFHDGNVTRNARLLARCVVDVWGRYKDRCIEREPQSRRLLEADFARKRWIHLFEEGCALRREGQSAAARRHLSGAIALRPAQWRGWAFWAATFLPVGEGAAASRGRTP